MTHGHAGTAGIAGTALEEPVRGDLLSCYSTAVAGLLGTLGIPHLLAFGAQLFLGARTDGQLTEFLHYHTPLTGDGELYRVDLCRRGAADPEAAAGAIVEEAASHGVAVVTGCTTDLPWLDTGTVDPAPHWFLLRSTADRSTADRSSSDRSGSEPGGGLLHVDDRFTWVDDAGEHLGHTGTVARSDLGALAHSPLPVNAEHLSRERWALGDSRVRPSWSDERPWQWLACGSTEVSAAEPVEWGRTLLGRTAEGAISSPEVAAEGWSVGRAAFDILADTVAAQMTEPGATRNHNDLWVASRNRLMFVAGLRQAHETGVAPGLDALADWVDENLLPSWAILIRTMRYNALKVAAGSRPRLSVLDDIRRIGALEEDVRDRLGKSLAAC